MFSKVLVNGKKRSWSFCQFLWCKHSHHKWFQAINVMFLNEEMRRDELCWFCDPAANTDLYLQSWCKPLRSWWIIFLICTHAHIYNQEHVLYCHLTPLVGCQEPCNQAHQYFSSKNAWIFTFFVINTIKQLISFWVKLVTNLVLVPNLPKNSVCRLFWFSELWIKACELGFYFFLLLYFLWTWSLNLFLGH